MVAADTQPIVILDNEDAALIGAIRRGDEEAFRKLFDQHVDAVYAVAARIVGQGAAAEDVVQETFLAAFRSIGGFGMRCAVRTWLHRIAVNFALKHRARATRKLQIETLVEVGSETDTVAQMIARFDLEQVAAALGGLDDRKREALLLHGMHGMTAQEIADTLGAPLSTILSRLSRGRRELATRLSRGNR